MMAAETGSKRLLFNSDGELMLPPGAVREFRDCSRISGRIHTGRMARCHRCGHEWEIGVGRTRVRRCHSCGAHVRVDMEATA